MMVLSCCRRAGTRRRCKLIVLTIETGGRWSEEAVQTMKMLAHSKARDAPSYIQFPDTYRNRFANRDVEEQNSILSRSELDELLI